MLRMTTTSMQRIHKDQKPLLYSRVLSPRKIECYINSALWCFLLLSILVSPQLVNAQQYNNVDLPQCASNETLYCRPRTGDQFNWTDPITFVWRSSAQPFVAGSGFVDINLWRIFDQKLCGKWKGVSFSDGYVVRTADPTCFDKVVDSTAPANTSSWQFAFKIVNPNDNTTSLGGSGPTFYIYKYDTSSNTASSPTDIAPTVITSTLVTQDATPGASSASNTLENAPKSKTLTPLLIAVISGAVVAVLVAIIAIIAATRARKRSRKHQSLSAISTSSNTPMIHSASFLGKGHKGDPDNPIEASSIHSTTPLAKQTSVSSFTQKLNSGIGIITQTTTTTSSVKSNPLQPPAVSFSDPSVPITTSDAAMISDAFRKTLRKPDWKAEDDEDEDDAEVGLSPEELRRRREAKELLKKELAEEGRGLHSVQRRQTKLLVHKVDEEDDDTATNTSTLGPGSSITSIVSGGRNQGNSDIV